MTSRQPTAAYVWVWLPHAVEPVVAGVIEQHGALVMFNYGQSYLARPDAMPLYLPELPLRAGRIEPAPGLTIAGCIADAGPDAWGQRVILNRHASAGELANAATADLAPITFLIESGSDRIGALDFQHSPTQYVARTTGQATLDELAESAARVERGELLTPALDQALLHGSSIGGARPKALITHNDRSMIAKFSSTTDTYPVVKGEFVAMELARRAGLNVAPVTLSSALGRDVLLIERFDRVHASGGVRRRAVVSALTMLELSELAGRYGTYVDLADIIRARFHDARATLRELFARITFNILVGNNDDHARNHAAFWDGSMLTLTPAYDICPQPRAGGEAQQALAFRADGFRMSQVAGCIDAAATYLLTAREARDIIDEQIRVIETEFTDACDAAELSAADRATFWHRQFLNPYSVEDY